MDSPSNSRPYRLGVLFVHGIGTQRSGETLVQWGDALVEVLTEATRNKVVATVEKAHIGDSTPITQAEVTIRSQTPPPEPWLITEAWWADAFPAPSYRDLVSWGIRALPWSIAFYIAQRYWQTSRQSALAKIWSVVLAYLQLAIALLAAPILLLLLAMTLVLAALPIAQLRSKLLSAQSALTATVGDTLAFVESPLRAALIRSRICERLAWLKPQCDKTIIIAHSQGAAVVLDALGGISLPGEPVNDHRQLIFPDTLLTFGAGTNQLVSNKVVASRLSTLAANNPVPSAILALMGTVAIAAWMFADVNAGKTSSADLVRTFGFWLLWLAALTVIGFVGKWLARTIAPKSLSGERTLISYIFEFAPVAGGMMVGIFLMIRSDLPFGSVSFLIVAFMASIGSIAAVLSGEMQIVSGAVRRPRDLNEWVDIYASADPVPNGPTMTEDKMGPRRSIPIWNRGSMLSDHTAYWDNRDGFVLRVVKLCAQTAESAWASDLPPDSDYVDMRARWRVSWLRAMQWAATVGVIAGSFGSGLIYREQIVVPFDLPRWMPLAIAQYIAIVVVTFFAVRAVGGILTLLWSHWVRSEQSLVLSGGTPEGTPWLSLTFMVMVPWLLLFVAWFAFTPDSTRVIHDWQDIAVLPFGAFGFALVSVAALVFTVMRPPTPEQPATKAPAQEVASLQP